MVGIGGVAGVFGLVMIVAGLTISDRHPPHRATPGFTESAGLLPSSSPPRPMLGDPAKDMSDGSLNRALREFEKTNLDYQTEQSLLALARAALLADLTGTGRDRFPGYLPGPAPVRVYLQVRVQAGVARRVDDSAVEAHLLWAGTRPGGDGVERQTAIIRLRYLDGSWISVRS